MREDLSCPARVTGSVTGPHNHQGVAYDKDPKALSPPKYTLNQPKSTLNNLYESLHVGERSMVLRRSLVPKLSGDRHMTHNKAG